MSPGTKKGYAVVAGDAGMFRVTEVSPGTSGVVFAATQVASFAAGATIKVTYLNGGATGGVSISTSQGIPYTDANGLQSSPATNTYNGVNGKTPAFYMASSPSVYLGALAVFGSDQAVVKPGASIYVCHPSSWQREFQNALEATGFEVRCQIIWAKNTFAWGFGRQILKAEGFVAFRSHWRFEAEFA
jgi:hypothetical protein